jgi:hypothetical protein
MKDDIGLYRFHPTGEQPQIIAHLVGIPVQCGSLLRHEPLFHGTH